MWQKLLQCRRFKPCHAAHLAVALFFCHFSALIANEATWLTGNGLRQALDKHVAVTWENATARQALNRFSNSQRVAVILDRRLDPDRRMELALKDIPLGHALKQISAGLNGDSAIVGSVVYLGPPAAVRRVRTLAALRMSDLAALPPPDHRQWQRLSPWQWDDLSEPRALLTSLASDLGITIVGLELIPHDLWSAANLPPMAVPERLTLILNQFDLTYELINEGKAIRLLPVPNHPQIELGYPVGLEADRIATKLSAMPLLKEATIRSADGKLAVRGTMDEHDVVRDLLAGKSVKRTSTQDADKRYTLRVELPVGKALEQLGKQLDLEVQIDHEAISTAGRSLDFKVKLDLKEATFEELFEALLTPAGLTFTRTGKVLRVRPQE